MTVQIAIVLLTFVLFVAVIISGKAKIHVASMLIPVVLEVTGVLSFKDAWGGMLNSSLIMMGAMFVVGAAISKTSIINRMSRAFIKPGASDFQIMLGLSIPILALGCVVNPTGVMTIMIPMITAICVEQKRSLSKFMLPAATLAQLCSGFIPIGGNAGSYLAQNTIIENLGGIGEYTYFTNMLVKAPIVLIGIPFILFITLKMSPDYGNVPGNAALEANNEKIAANAKKRSSKLTDKQEKFVAVVFLLTIIGIVACAITGISTWYPATIAAGVLVLSGVLSDREAMNAVGNPVMFITIGTLPLSTALKTTGADVLMADAFNKVTNGMSPFMIMISMYLLCMILTQFVSNSAVSNAFKTLAAMIAVQNGYSSVALMSTAIDASSNCYLLPMAGPCMTMGYEAGEYKMKDFIKVGLPLCLLRLAVYAVYVPLMFPLMKP